jgi:hypothetical protein
MPREVRKNTRTHHRLAATSDQSPRAAIAFAMA